MPVLLKKLKQFFKAAYLVKNFTAFCTMQKKTGFLSFCLLMMAAAGFAQNPYVLNGSARQDNCNCYTLTTETTSQSGSIWNKNKIDISQPFDFFFNVYLGCKDADGADGIVFVLQPVSTSLGSVGEGMGFQNIAPSIGITIDTWQNTNHTDPAYDHIAIQANGDVNHTSFNNLAGPVTALSGSDNIEDCQWHILEINWIPAVDSLIIKMDGLLRVSLHKDIISEIFNNDPMVYWGFTSATGGSVNFQKMCTTLDAGIVLAPTTNTCIGTPLTFVDSSVSFGSITQWYWNFGDGTTSALPNPPAHTYAAPGYYTVSHVITGGDGCTSDTTKQPVTVGSYPIADFNINTSPVCDNRGALFTDATTVHVGTANYWYWNFGNGVTSSLQNPAAVNYTAGEHAVQFFVKTAEGCASDTAIQSFTVLPAPVIDFEKEDACKLVPVSFTAENTTTAIGVKQWYWDFGDNSFSTEQVTQHSYADSGTYNVSLSAQAENGCIVDSVFKPVKIYATNAFAGNDTTILQSYPFQLHASGGSSYVWSPAVGLDNPFIANPVATLDHDITYTLTASSVMGCATVDSIHLKVVKGPEIYVPTGFTPNRDGLNDKFKIIPVGVQLSFFKVMNRWGQALYSSVNINQGWDGTVNGIPQPAGTYIWMVSGKTPDGTVIKKQGTIVLIR